MAPVDAAMTLPNRLTIFHMFPNLFCVVVHGIKGLTAYRVKAVTGYGLEARD